MNEPQHMIAFAKANRVRFARAALKRDLREGRLSLSDALEEEYMRSMTVFGLLCVQHRWADVRARKALSRAASLLGMAFPLPENKTVGSLTDRQKRALLQACGCESDRKAAA